MEIPGCNTMWIFKAGIHGWNDWAGVSAHWVLDGDSVIQCPVLGNSQSWCPFWDVSEPSIACLPLEKRSTALVVWALCGGWHRAALAGRAGMLGWPGVFSALWKCRSLYHNFLKILWIVEPDISVICANAMLKNNKWNSCRGADSLKASWILFW